MNKVKKLFIVFISFILFIIFGAWSQNSLAVSLTANSGYALNANNLASKSSKYFCIQEGQPLNHNTTYAVKKTVTIDLADNEKDYVMCRIAASANANSRPEDSVYAFKQKLVYAYFGTWRTAHSGLDKYAITTMFQNNSDVKAKINEYKADFTEWKNARDASIKNNKTVNSLKKEIYNYNGQSYIKVGPFNFSYTGNNEDVEFNITNQSGSKLSVLFGVYSGSTLKVSSGFEAEDYSGKDFYLLINTSSNATSFNLQVNLTDSIRNYSGTVQVLQGTSNGGKDPNMGKTWQNVIKLEAEYESKTVTDRVEMKNIPLIGELEIEKQDSDTAEALNNVGFVLYNTQLEKYVQSSNSNGVAKYTSDRTQAKEFITGVDGDSGKILIKGLLPGTYEIYETKNPNYGYDEISGDTKVKTVTVNPTSLLSNQVNDSKRTIADGYYEIESALSSNMVIDIKGGKTKNSTNVQIYTRNNSGAQQFYVQYLGDGYYVIRSAIAYNKVLDVADGSTESGANVQIYSSNSSSAQKWLIKDAGEGYYYIVNQGGEKYLDVSGGKAENSTNIQVYNSNKSNAQKFKFNSKNASTNITTTILNEKNVGNMRIEKRDETNLSAMAGISFNIKNSDGEYIIAVDNSGEMISKVSGEIYIEDIRTTTDINSATQFITNDNGIIEIRNIIVDTYYVTETSLGNNYYGYELDDEYISWSSNMGNGTGVTSSIYVNRQILEDENTPEKFDILDVRNKRKYVKLSGYAWEDIPWDIGKTTETNNLYQETQDDKNDQLLENITVRLRDSEGKIILFKDINGNMVSETKTNTNGKYTMADVLIDNLDEYYIEFSYNGMAYESVRILDINNKKGTDAIEGTNRGLYNENFAEITTGVSNDSTGKKTNDIKYNEEKYRSWIDYEGEYVYGYNDDVAEQVEPYTGYSVEEYKEYCPVNGVAKKYVISSTTYNAYKSVGESGYLSDIITAEEIRKNSIEEVGAKIEDGINLGIKKRERPDLSVVKDIESAKVSIVGTQHIYKYGDRFNEELWAEDSNGVSGHELDPKVKFEEKYSEMSYTRPLYASDVYYTGENGEPLSLELTYKISVRNNSTNLGANIYELDDYFDSKYNLIAIGTDINADGSIKEGTEITNYTEPEEINDQYKKMTIGGNNEVILELDSLQEGFIYVQFKVDRDNIMEIIETEDNEYAKLDNISEIKKYGITKINNDGASEVYAGIDKDSQPGNTDINDKTTWEDDTDKAPGMLLVLQQEREANGKVFLDTDESIVEDGQQVHTGIARQGNGQYDDDEKGIKNVKVTLVDTDGNVVQVYNKETGEYEEAVTYTDENGEYTLEGFIPGEYQIQYTWGGNLDGHGINSTYTLDNGEKEIVNVQNYKSTIVNEEVWNAKETADKWYNNTFKQNYPNIEWNAETNTEIRTSDAVDDYQMRLAIDSETGEITYSEKQKLENTYNYESTEGKYTNMQMNSNTRSFKVYIEYTDTEDNNKNMTEKNDEFKNVINNIDLGITERSRQVLELDKHITATRIVLSDGNVLVNAKLENGELVDQAQYVSVTPDSPGANGMVRIEVDEELIQGARVEIQYGLEIKNISEVEYQTQEFYMYGVGNGEDPNKLVTLQPALIIDYLDNNLATDMSQNAIWDSIGQEQRKQQLIDTGLLSEDLEEVITETSRVITTDEVREQKLVPIGLETISGESKSSVDVNLLGYKLLSSNGDETFLENNAEIIKVIKNNGGGTLVTTPGNYNPSDSSTSELDDSTSESLVILPPTGLITNYIAYIILAISSLGIIVAGVILIKKFVLK